MGYSPLLNLWVEEYTYLNRDYNGESMKGCMHVDYGYIDGFFWQKVKKMLTRFYKPRSLNVKSDNYGSTFRSFSEVVDDNLFSFSYACVMKSSLY